MAEGIITRKDIITDEAINWGPEYEAQVKKAIKVNEDFVATIIDISKANEAARKSNNQTEYLKQAQELKLKKQEAISLIKQEEELEKSLEKIKQEKINTQKKEVELENKKQAAKDKSNKLTIEERVLNEANNRALRQQARETLGLVGEYDKLNARRRQAQTNLANLLAEGKRADQTQKEYNRTIKAAQAEFDKYNEKIKRVDAATDKFTNNIGNYKSAFQGLRGIASDLIAGFGVLTGVALFVGTVKSIFEVTRELQSLNLALKSVTGTDAELARAQAFLTEVANKNGLEIKNLTAQYTRFYVAAKDKLAVKEIEQTFNDIATAGAALGLSNEALERSFTAVNQMLSKGTVSSEELRGQLAESLPGAVQAMVAATRKLHPELKDLDEKGFFQLVKDGKILANEVLPETAKQLLIITGAAENQNIETLSKSVNRLSNAWTNFVKELSDGDGTFSQWLARTASGAANIVNWTTNAIKSARELRDEEKQAYRTDLYKQELDSLQSLGNEAKKQAAARKPILEQQFDDEKKIIDALQLRLKTQQEGSSAYLKTLKELRVAVNDAYGTAGQLDAVKKVLTDGTNKNSTGSTETEAERNKRLAKLKKESDDYIKIRKKEFDDEFDLLSFRNEREIYYNQLIVDDDKKSAEERVNAFLNIEQLKRSQADVTLRNQLEKLNLASIAEKKAQAELNGDYQTYSKEKIAQLINVSEKEIDEIIRTGTIKKNATNEEILAFEQYKLAIEKITQGSEANRQKLIDSEADKVQKSLDLSLKNQDTALNNALTAETEMYNKGVQSLEETERKKNEIRLDSAKRAIQTQIDVLQAELDADAKKEENARLSAEKRIEIQNKLSKLGIELAELDYKTKEDYEKRYLQLQEETANRIKDLQQSLKDALIDFVNALFDARIQAIDAERQASNDYYDNEIEKAGDDQRKKEDLQKLKEKKDKEFEDKRKKEVLKAAIFNRVVSLAQIAGDLAKTIVAINLAAAQMDALAAWGFGSVGATYRGLQIGLAVGTAALQTGAILATPLPKYRTGRRSGKAEAAIVGDGYVSEVITDSKGQNPRLTSAKPEITFLSENDMVFPNVSAYEQYLRNASMRNLSNASSRVNDFRFTQSSTYDKDILEELRRNTDAVKKGKMNITVKNEQPDYAHLAWAFKNNNWRN